MTFDERLRAELPLICSAYPGAMLLERAPGIVIADRPLCPGWNRPKTTIHLPIPTGYAVTPPDNFFTDVDLLLADGRLPANTGEAEFLGRRVRQFSWHVDAGTWRPSSDPCRGHNLLTFLLGVEARLHELD